MLTPTVPMLPPAIAGLEADDAYLQANARAFSLTEFANRLDLPSVSLPGDLRARQSIGLMLTGAAAMTAACSSWPWRWSAF